MAADDHGRPGWVGAAVVVVAAAWLVVHPPGAPAAQGPHRVAAAPADAAFVAAPDLPAADLHGQCSDLGARAAFYTTLVTCQQSATDLTWEYADPYLRLPRVVANSSCTDAGTYARDFTRPIVHRCTADTDGTLRWTPDPSWSRPAT